MNDENEDAKYDHPWTEEEWLAEFRRNDVRSAKFGELLETFADDPDGDEKIRREMGWGKNDGIERPWLDEFVANADDITRELDERRRLRDENEREGADDTEAEDEDFVDEDDPETWDDEKFEQMAELDARTRKTEDASADTGADDSDDVDPWDEDDDDDDPDPDYGPLRKIPAYAQGMKLSLEAWKLAKRYPEESWASDDQHELFCEAVGNIAIPSAKMAGGHSFGYDTNICGNIACNRIGLEALDKSLANFAELEQAGVLPPEFRDQIVPRVQELRQLIVERIETMRKRVWW